MRYGLIGFALGTVLGVGGMILLPRFADPYLPQALKPGVSVQGQVVAKQREPDRLLLTVRTQEGSTLVTFTKQIPEIDLLVQQADTIVLSLKHYRPFVENPEIVRVAKPEDQAMSGETMEPPAQPAPAKDVEGSL